MDANASPLLDKLSTTKEMCKSALSSPYFYFEVMCVSLSLALAWLVSILIRRRVDEYLAKHPPTRIDAAIITKPLLLLAPILTIFALSLATPIDIQFSSGTLIDAAMKITVAYLIAKGVLLVVRTRPIAWFIASIIMLIGVLRASGFLRDTLEYLRSVEFEFGKIKLSLLNIIHGFVALIVVFWVAGAVSRTLESYLRRSSRLNYNTRELIVKFFKIVIYFTALMLTMQALGIDLTAFAVFGGALGVGIGLGLQKITANFVSGITLLVERSIQIGDLIEVGGQTGWVRQLNIRYMLMETSDGRELLIPNDDLINTRVTNWTHTNAQARIDVKVGIDYDSDPAKAQELMLEAASEHKLCLKDPKPTCQIRDFDTNGVNFMLSFWIPNVQDGRNGPQSDVMFNILKKFGPAGIVIKVSPK